MAYCGPKGIPYRWFTGQTKENRWDDVSAAAAIAWQAAELDRCPTCGTHDSDWRDDDGVELRDPPFEVVRGKCLGCEMMEMWQADQEATNTRLPAGVRPRFQWLPPSDASDDVDGGVVDVSG